MSNDNTEQPLPVVLSRAWYRTDALEYFLLQAARGMRFLSGTITAAAEGVPCFVHYAVVCGDDWVTREAYVHVARAGTPKQIRLARTDAGVWQVDGSGREDLKGAVDIDVQWSPSTNALPINRLKLAVGESRDVKAAWVRIPELNVEILEQRYTRLADNAYRYESGNGGFVADLRVDSAGFVEQYGDIWTCIGAFNAR